MTDKEKYDFIDHVVHLTLSVEDRLLNEHGGDYSGLEEDGIDSNEYYRIITERVINILKKNNNYMQEEPVSEELEEAAEKYAYELFPSVGVANTETELAFKAGAKWKEKQMMMDATDVTVHIDAGNYPYISQLELYDYDNNVALAKEGDKYKVILIKED